MAFEQPQQMQDQDRSLEVARQIDKLKRVVKQLDEVKVVLLAIYEEVDNDVDSPQWLIDYSTALRNAANGANYTDFRNWLNNAVN